MTHMPALGRQEKLDLVAEIAASRPPADHGIRQYLMTPRSLWRQANLIGEFFRGQRVFFLGDDDHVSPLLAKLYGVEPVVYEYDPRVRSNLERWFGKLSVKAEVRAYDARCSIAVPTLCDSFYINGPYSADKNGLGHKVWLMRAMAACRPMCSGVMVMPRLDGNCGADWVDLAAGSVDRFVAANGFEVIGVDLHNAEYTDTVDVGLCSSNLYLERVDASKYKQIDPAGLFD